MNELSPNETLFKSWLEEHRGIVVKVSRSYAPDPADAADLQQELLLQLWLSLRSYSGQSKVSTWIYRVCLNTALSWRRGKSRRDGKIDREADVGELTTPALSPADKLSEQELLRNLYSAIQAIPQFDRALILLLLDGLAYKEIAEVTGLSENHIGVALTRARKRLAEKMKGVANELE